MVAVAHRATARVLAAGPAGPVPVADLSVTHLTTSLEPAEVITGVEFLALGRRTGSCFLEMARRIGDFAMAEVVATASIDETGQCDDVRLVVGAVSDRPADVSDTASALIGAPPGQAAVTEMARAAADEVEIGRAACRHPLPARDGRGAGRAGGWQGGRAGLRDGRGRDHERASAMSKHEVSLQVNGHPLQAVVEPNMSLLELLRIEAGAPEVKLGCGEGVCGTCTVLLDGEPVNACLMFAVQAEGREVTTVRGLTGEGRSCTRSSGASSSMPARSAGSARRGCC